MKISELDAENKENALWYQAKAEEHYDKKTDSLNHAFDWYLTREGSDYWNQLHHAILVDNNTPLHYKSLSGKDVINFCHDNNDLNFCRGSAIKYIVRAGKKEDEIDDLKKAIDFLQREIKNLEK